MDPDPDSTQNIVLYLDPAETGKKKIKDSIQIQIWNKMRNALV